MEYGQVPGIDRPISRLVQGTVMLGRDRASDFRLLDSVYAAGGTAFDTARHYGDAIEETLGRWARERGVRDRIVVVGKGAHHEDGAKRVTPREITADLERSLRRLGFDHLDLYLLHRDDPSQPVGPIVETLHGHRRNGKIRAYGGSNWTTARLAEANAYAAAHGLTPFAASSPNFSLAVPREPPWEDCVSLSGPAGAAARDWYARNHMPVFAWSSLANAFFSGRVTRENCADAGGPFGEILQRCYCTEENLARLDRARQLAAERGLTVPQVALAYVLAQPLNLFALVGCETGDEFRAAAAACDVHLTPDEVAWLEGA